VRHFQRNLGSTFTSQRPIVTYAFEMWALKKQIDEKLLMFERKIIRRIYGPTVGANGLRRRRTNEEIGTLSKQRNIVRYIKAQIWLGHLERMPENRKRKKKLVGRPKKKWEEYIL
jgi:hypothetical protein